MKGLMIGVAEWTLHGYSSARELLEARRDAARGALGAVGECRDGQIWLRSCHFARVSVLGRPLKA